MKRAFIIIGAVAAAALIALAFWLVFSAAPAKKVAEPTPTLTMQPTPEPTATAPVGEDNQHSEHDDLCSEEDVANAGPGEYCSAPSGLYGDALQAAMAKTPVVDKFAEQWVKHANGETKASREARLLAVGASPEVAKQQTGFARENTDQYKLTANSSLINIDFTYPLDKDTTGTSFAVSMNVFGEYRLPTGSGTDQRIGGTLTVWLDDSGRIVKVAEDFKALSEMR